MSIFQGSAGNSSMASASSEYSSSYTAEDAFDGDVSSYLNRWLSADDGYDASGLPVSGNGEWYQLAFGAAKEVLKFRLFSSNTQDKIPRKITPYVSGTGAFAGEEVNTGQIDYGVTAPSINAWTDWWEIVTSADAAYLRLEINQTYNGVYTGFCEIEFQVVDPPHIQGMQIMSKSIINPFFMFGGV